MITIIDYNMGNVASIQNILKRIGYSSVISSQTDHINNTELLILPGVGSFDYGVSNLKSMNLTEIVKESVIVNKTPILGICLGMQLLTHSSEEGAMPGLGLINAKTKKFVFNDRSLKIPHMGWNYIDPLKNHNLFKSDYDQLRYYFVHSYYVECENHEDILTSTLYGSTFTSAFQKDNIFGFQFHPEKSHKYGMTLLRNFMEYLNVSK